MTINRRTLLLGTAASSVAPFGVAISAPVVLKGRLRRVSQGELSGAIEAHAIWFADNSLGRRAMFADCDLSDLDFHQEQTALVNLRGSDFTGSDLTGIRGDNVSFLRSSLHGARLSWSQLKRPCFSYASLRSAACDHVVWGWNDWPVSNPSRAAPEDGGVFFHTDAAKSNFSQCSIRGMFVEATFIGANLAEADLSYSTFPGQRHYETSFYGANLSRAKFRSAVIAAARFCKATCDGANLTDAEIGCWVKFPAGTTVTQIA
ncbi:MAG: pentapeptide repeat-containing protein [Bradyrhizobium sp.]